MYYKKKKKKKKKKKEEKKKKRKKKSIHIFHLNATILNFSDYLSNSRLVYSFVFEPLHAKTNNLGFRSGPTQTGLYSHRSRLEP